MADDIDTSVSSDTLPHGRRILACLDRSSFSEVCVPYAIWLAETFESPLTLLHVMEGRQDANRSQTTNDAVGWEISRQEARSYLERIREQAAGALRRTVDLQLEQGRPAERIIDLVRELGAGLIVLGSRGETGVTEWTLGSTVQQVLAVTRSSVLIAHSTSTVPTSVAPKRILVPLDGSVRAESVLPAAVRLATSHDAELLLVHVIRERPHTTLWEEPEDIALEKTLANHLERSANQYLDRLRRQLGPPSGSSRTLSVQTLAVRHTSEHRCLLEISQKREMDLIVLSAHGAACDSARSFGCVSGYLLTHSTVPLLVLQDLPDGDAQRAPDANAELSPPSPRASYAPGLA